MLKLLPLFSIRVHPKLSLPDIIIPEKTMLILNISSMFSSNFSPVENTKYKFNIYLSFNLYAIIFFYNRYNFTKGSPFDEGGGHIVTFFARGRTSPSRNFRMENVLVWYKT